MEKIWENAIDLYWRAANYLTVAQIFLKKNCLLKTSLKREDLKEYFNGHWGTCPGINFIYAHLNSLIIRTGKEVQLVIGAGHAGCALASNLYLEGTLHDYYAELGEGVNGIECLLNANRHIKGFRSEISSVYPGTIYDGGELGYSFSVAVGASLDNRDKYYVCIIGDGEAETGTLSSSWLCSEFIKNNVGKVLPIVHLNGFKMGGKSLLSKMSKTQLISYWTGLGYKVRIVGTVHGDMIDALDWAFGVLEDSRPVAPLIILCTPKGWTAPNDTFIKIENTAASHKVPISDFYNEYNLKYLENWLKSYNAKELFGESGVISKNIKKNIPLDSLKMGKRNYFLHSLEMPLIEADLCININRRKLSNKMDSVSRYFENVFKKNLHSFRIFSPDELSSNGLGVLVEHEDKPYESVIEILNENICQGLMQGYILTGRQAMMISYEAFMPIVSSMVAQCNKYLVQLFSSNRNCEVASFNYILTSTCWANTYSHQNPEFINTLIIQRSPFVKIFFPLEVNTLLLTIEKSLKSRRGFNVIVTSKHDVIDSLDMNKSLEMMEKGYFIYEKNCELKKQSDICLMAVGDYSVAEMLEVIKEMKTYFGGMTYRFVVFTELTKLGTPEIYSEALTNQELEEITQNTSKVIVHFHGFPSTLYALLAERNTKIDFSVYGYKNKSYCSTNTLGKMAMNECSRYHILDEINNLAMKKNVIGDDEYMNNKKRYYGLIKDILDNC